MKTKKARAYISFSIVVTGLLINSCSGGGRRTPQYGQQCPANYRPLELNIPTQTPPNLITLKSENIKEEAILPRPSGTYSFNGATVHYVNTLGDKDPMNDLHITVSQGKTVENNSMVWKSQVQCIRNGRTLISKIKSGETSILIPGLTRLHQPYENNQIVSDIKYNQYTIVFDHPLNNPSKLFLLQSFDLSSDETNNPQKVYKPGPDGFTPEQEVVFYQFVNESGRELRSYQVRSKYQPSPNETIYLSIDLMRCADPHQPTEEHPEHLTEEELVENYEKCLKELEIRNN